MVIRMWLREFEMKIFIKNLINIFYANILPITIFCLAVIASVLITTSAHATINCAGYLPNSYFERIENENSTFAGKLINAENNTQQLQDLNGKVLLDNLTDGYVLMDKYLLAKQYGRYGVANAAGKLIIPFEYQDIQIESDIATSFIVSITNDEVSKQGIINRYGDWIYPLTTSRIEHAHYDSNYDQDYFIVVNHKNLATDKGLTGLLDDRGYWAIMPQYDEVQPLNACTEKPLYLQVRQQDKTALVDQNEDIILPFQSEQHIELFNNELAQSLFLRSTLFTGSTATGMSADIKDEIESAQIIDIHGKAVLTSEAPITKLLYQPLYTYQQEGKFGIIDNKANIIAKPQFDNYRDEGAKVWLEKDGKLILLETVI